MHRHTSNLLQAVAICAVLTAVFAIGPVIADRVGASQALAGGSSTPSPSPTSSIYKIKDIHALPQSDLSQLDKMQLEINKLKQQVSDLQTALQTQRDGTTAQIQDMKNQYSALAGNLNSMNTNLASSSAQLSVLNQNFANHHHTLQLFSHTGVMLVTGQSNGSISAFSVGDVLLAGSYGSSHDVNFNTSGPQ